MMNESNIVKEYEYMKPEIDKVDYLLDKVIKDSEKKLFHTFKYRCVSDIKITNITKNEKVILNFNHNCLELKSEYY